MPPSGYNTIQFAGVDTFLRRCWDALVDEAKERGESLRQALTRELSDIERYRPASPGKGATAVLDLTHEFYKNVLEASNEPSDKDVDVAIGKVSKEVLAVHIPQK